MAARISSDILTVAGRDKEFLTTEDLIMPLSDDDRTVDMLLVTVGSI